MEESPSANEQITSQVKEVFDIDSVTWSKPEEKSVVRYFGSLLLDSAEAYDKLADSLEPFDLTPLFRKHEGKHLIILIKDLPEPKESNPWINLILFILTLFSVLFAGASYVYAGPETEPTAAILGILSNLGQGWPFAVSLLGILLAHEFGHYLAGKYHKSHVTLPYFIPLPIPFSLGTMGAFIAMKSPPKNKRALLDIGIAGPLSGLVVAIPVLLIGISLSTVSDLPINLSAEDAFMLEGNSIFYLISKYIIHGQWLPEPASYGGVSPIIYWIKYFFTGNPIPLGGLDIQMHQVAWAGWAGLLITALNLIPAGQLDGGHLLYTLFGDKSQRVLPFILAVLVMLGFGWNGWWLWAFLVYFFGRAHAEPLDSITELDRRRKILALIGLIIFLLIFVPIPLRTFIGPL
jgi:membrane-associated protease RseP (regulator of RpoE activity)